MAVALVPALAICDGCADTARHGWTEEILSDPWIGESKERFNEYLAGCLGGVTFTIGCSTGWAAWPTLGATVT